MSVMLEIPTPNTLTIAVFSVSTPTDEGIDHDYELKQQTEGEKDEQMTRTGDVRDVQLKDEKGDLLSPVDRGFMAWRFLVVIFLIEGFIWGEYM